MTKISVVIPCYYSEKTIASVVEATIEEFKKLKKYQYEFILVNDGSEDGTFSEIIKLAEKYPFVTGLDLSRNFGQHNAILAGMKQASGDYILGMDDDFQTHPSQIEKLILKLEEGYDVVYGKFQNRQHSVLRNMQSRVSAWTAEYLLDAPKELKACPMYLIRSFVKEEIIKSQSSYSNLKGLFLRTVSKIANVDIEHFERKNGKSGYTLKKLIRLWSAYINYSVKPVALCRKLGILLSIAAMLYFLITLMSTSHALHFIAAEIMFFSGVIIFILGLLGEYLVRMFMVITHEPQYVIRRIVTKDDEKKDTDTGCRKCTD